MALLAWARDHGHEVGVVGSGSNLLVADEGVRGLVMKLDKDLAQIERDGTRLACGGGARLPAVSRAGGARRADGDRVRREHPRHGRRRGADERERLRRRAGAGARVRRRRDGRGRRAARAGPARLRLPPLEPRSAARSSRARPSRCRRRRSERVKATLAEMRAKRQAAQPSGIKTFGSTFRNPATTRAPRAAAPGSCSTRPAAAGCASAAPASPRSTRTSSRTTAERAPPTWSR